MSWKTDCNFTPNAKDELFMGEDWSERKPGQPFFARITFGGTHRAWNRDPQRPIDIEDIELPPYYPDTPFCRRDWANGLEQMQSVDREVGELLKRLDDEGLTDSTIVFFIADHGRCHIRGKQLLYDGGIRIPMIMRWLGKVAPGQVSEDLVMSIDICATILEAAGIEPPVPLHGENLLGGELKQRKYRAVSNHENGLKRMAFPLFNCKDITIDGGGSLFVFPSRRHNHRTQKRNSAYYCVCSHGNSKNASRPGGPVRADESSRTSTYCRFWRLCRPRMRYGANKGMITSFRTYCRCGSRWNLLRTKPQRRRSSLIDRGIGQARLRHRHHLGC